MFLHPIKCSRRTIVTQLAMNLRLLVAYLKLGGSGRRGDSMSQTDFSARYLLIHCRGRQEADVPKVHSWPI